MHYVAYQLFIIWCKLQIRCWKYNFCELVQEPTKYKVILIQVKIKLVGCWSFFTQLFHLPGREILY